MFDNAIDILRIVFRDKCFDLRRIKDRHSCFIFIHALADGFRDIDKTVKEDLQVSQETLFKASDFGSIRNFGKAAEITKIFRVMKKDQKQGVRRWMIKAQRKACKGYLRERPVDA